MTGALVALTLLGCGPAGDSRDRVGEEGEEEPSRAERPELPGETPRQRCEAFRARGLLIEGRSRRELRAELGEPEERDRETEPNRHAPHRVDTLWTLVYEGVEARIRTAGGRDLAEGITVTDNRHLRFREPAMGTPPQKLSDLLGEAEEHRGGDRQYRCVQGPGPEAPVTFLVEEARVAGITWHFYVD